MAKRLQVILKDPEYREIQRMARSRHLTRCGLLIWSQQSAQRKLSWDIDKCLRVMLCIWPSWSTMESSES